MKIVWSLLALADRAAILDYIEADNLRAAARVDDRIEARVDQLAIFSRSGRPGRIAGTRELVLQQTPYIAVYTIEDDAVRILRVLHGAQLWHSELNAFWKEKE